MAFAGSLQLSLNLGFGGNQGLEKQFEGTSGRGNFHLLKVTNTSLTSFSHQHFSSIDRLRSSNRSVYSVRFRSKAIRCQVSPLPSQICELPIIKAASTAFTRTFNALHGSPLVFKLAPAIGIIIFAGWGLGPLMRQSRNLLLHKNDGGWKKSTTYHVTTSYIQPLLLWTGVILICRALDPIVLPTEASQVVKKRVLNFVGSLSTVLAFAYCLSSMTQQAQKFFMETSDSSNTREMSSQFAGKAVCSAVWVASISLFMELLGFSTQKWLTAGGLGTVLLTLAGREIFTNFLSSAMIHATRPFVVNEWIQTKIEGYEVSGTVEHVGWWSPTIIRGEDREAVHIPNHKFTVNVVRNLSQKTHWRIKTHLAISHLDVHKISNIVADMRKVLAKNPQVEQQRLHRRVFLDNVNPENQALLILVSCFVKTSHHEEYLCVKEAIFLDLLRVISHHRARLATPIRTVQKLYNDADLDNMPFAESVYNPGGVSANRPLLLIEPSYKINGEDKGKSQTRSSSTQRHTSDTKADTKVGVTPKSDIKKASPGAQSAPRQAGVGGEGPAYVRSLTLDFPKRLFPRGLEPGTFGPQRSNLTVAPRLAFENSDIKAENTKIAEMSNPDWKEDNISELTPITMKSTPKSAPKTNPKVAETSSYGSKGSVSNNMTKDKKVSDSKQLKNSKFDNSSLLSSEIRTDNTSGVQDSPQISRPILEDNIVLGVALEGSKRTLPIEEDMDSAATVESKELASTASRNGNLSSNSEKDRKDGQNPASLSTKSGGSDTS